MKAFLTQRFLSSQRFTASGCSLWFTPHFPFGNYFVETGGLDLPTARSLPLESDWVTAGPKVARYARVTPLCGIATRVVFIAQPIPNLLQVVRPRVR